MNLTLFFRLQLIAIFQDSKKDYNGHCYFYCPCVYAKDGFSVSLQINAGNYCSSENGYRMLGHTMQEVEFGYPSENEPLFIGYGEDDRDLTQTVGRIPVTILEEIFEKHGGIDWEKTISIEAYNRLVNN